MRINSETSHVLHHEPAPTYPFLLLSQWMGISSTSFAGKKRRSNTLVYHFHEWPSHAICFIGTKVLKLVSLYICRRINLTMVLAPSSFTDLQADTTSPKVGSKSSTVPQRNCIQFVLLYVSPKQDNLWMTKAGHFEVSKRNDFLIEFLKSR